MQLRVPLLEKYSEESAQHTDTCLLRGLSLGAHPYVKHRLGAWRERDVACINSGVLAMNKKQKHDICREWIGLEIIVLSETSHTQRNNVSWFLSERNFFK